MRTILGLVFIVVLALISWFLYNTIFVGSPFPAPTYNDPVTTEPDKGLRACLTGEIIYDGYTPKCVCEGKESIVNNGGVSYLVCGDFKG